MEVVVCPNCDGRGWVPIYDVARRNADGSPVMIGQSADRRCAGSGVIQKPPVLPGLWARILTDAGWDPENPTAPTKPTVVQ